MSFPVSNTKTLLLIVAASGSLMSEAKSNDYPKVAPELVPKILAMESGMSKEPVQIPWRLFVPEGAEIGSDTKLPLVFFLHGAGRRGDDNVGPMELAKTFWDDMQEQYPCFVLVPQCPKGATWAPLIKAEGSTSGFINYTAEETANPYMQAALNILDEVLEKWPVDTNRIYITGQSMGGYGTFEALMRRPDFFAAANPICGGGDPGRVAEYANVPIWVWHGANDAAVLPENSHAMVEALTEAGGQPKFTELQNVGHGAWEPAYKSDELYHWLFSQHK